jgi:hypothetical protein
MATYPALLAHAAYHGLVVALLAFKTAVLKDPLEAGFTCPSHLISKISLEESCI